jgi:hypothetical protein
MYRYEWLKLKTRKEVKEWFRRQASWYVWEKYCKECNAFIKQIKDDA